MKAGKPAVRAIIRAVKSVFVEFVRWCISGLVERDLPEQDLGSDPEDAVRLVPVLRGEGLHLTESRRT